MKSYNIYICGVGGQGIGLLAEIMLRAADHSGLGAKLVDTHGLAQRGGIVVSHLRLGSNIHSPMVSIRQADLGIALERHEALRTADTAVRDEGSLIYYDTVIQPLGVRLGQDQEVTNEEIAAYCSSRKIHHHLVLQPGLANARQQNIAVLGAICAHCLVPQVTKNAYLQAMEDLMAGSMLKENVTLFEELTSL